MDFLEKLRSGLQTYSFEFFPPKNPEGWVTLYSTLAEISGVNPDFVSVTYGAGGSTREKTLDLVRRIQNELKIQTMAHLTCVGHSKSELGEILQELQNSGIKFIIALRGDPPKGEIDFRPHPEGFSHASDLIRFIKNEFAFWLAAASYPEKHPEATSLSSDIDYLKLKQDMGADFSITQLFFENEDFYRFRDAAVSKGVTIPLVAGIMPVTGLKQLKRFEEMAGAKIPGKLIQKLHEGPSVVHQGIEFSTEQCEDLIRNEVAGLHLYTLNQSLSSVRIIQNLKSKNLI